MDTHKDRIFYKGGKGREVPRVVDSEKRNEKRSKWAERLLIFTYFDFLVMYGSITSILLFDIVVG